jgi:hypothetical protein
MTRETKNQVRVHSVLTFLEGSTRPETLVKTPLFDPVAAGLADHHQACASPDYSSACRTGWKPSFACTPPLALVDYLEKHHFDFRRFDGWFADVQRRPLELGTIRSPGSSTCVWSSGKTCPTSSVLLPAIATRLCAVFNG